MVCASTKTANGARRSSPEAVLNRPNKLGLSRAKLVGKFPEIQHQPAPKASSYRLSEDERDELVARMILV